MTSGVVVLECVVPPSYVLRMLSELVVEALPVGIGVGALVDANIIISAAVMTPLEFPMSIL